jgi:23S rRNA pseudouridine1911/1915/1917 synthase
LVVAKNDYAHEFLAAQFKNKTTHRIYHAVVLGRPAKANGKIQSFLARHPRDRKKFASVRDDARLVVRDPQKIPPVGKWAVTEYEVLQTLASGISLLRLKLQTGRTHQIRVHLSELGHPIVADPIYGRASAAIAKAHPYPRLALHASELGFVHPTSGETLLFRAPWPDDLRPLIEKFGEG